MNRRGDRLIEIEGSRVLIAGFGLEGAAAYRYLRGVSSESALGVYDEKNIAGLALPGDVLSSLESDKNTKWFQRSEEIDCSAYDFLLKSPGIRPSHPLLLRAHQTGLRIVTQIQLLFDRARRDQIIGITGTKGKSTTSTLLASVLETSGVRCSLIGNIGNPVIPIAMSPESNSTFVVELSSYQLSSVDCSPHIAVIQGIVPEHLDYHGSLDAYVEAKENITRFQSGSDFCIFNADSPISSILAGRSAAQKIPISIEKPLSIGGYLSDDALVVKTNESEWRIDRKIVPPDELPGDFNLYNVLAALIAAKLAGASIEGAQNAIKQFRALPHRMRVVAIVNGVKFIDDSIATVPAATIAALSTLGASVQTLILGGFDRGVPYEELAEFIIAKTEVANVIVMPPSGIRLSALLNEAANRTHRHIVIESCQNMRDVVEFAKAHTDSGRACLLSPAAPSFGLFTNYKERGDAFRDAALRNV